MKTNFKTILLVTTILGVAGCAREEPEDVVDDGVIVSATGTWLMSVDATSGPGTPTFVLEQKGDMLTGTYSGALGEAPVSGTVKGNDVVLTFKIDNKDQQVDAKYTGRMRGNRMSGQVVMEPVGEGTFKGKKK